MKYFIAFNLFLAINGLLTLLFYLLWRSVGLDPEFLLGTSLFCGLFIGLPCDIILLGYLTEQ